MPSRPLKAEDGFWTRYAVECVLPSGEDGPALLAARCRTATDAVRAAGKGVRFLRCVHLPEQSSAVLLFEATDLTAIDAVTSRVLGAGAHPVALGGGTSIDQYGAARRTR